MFTIALDHPHPFVRRPADHRVARWIRIATYRVQKARRQQRLLREIFKETRDPRVLEDFGMTPPRRSLLERFPMALVDIHR